MKLPDEPTMEGYTLNNIRMLLYGIPKIGKSTFASKFKKALFLACESGHKGLKICKLNITSWQDFLEAVDTLLELDDDDRKFKLIVIDTVSNLFKYCQDYVCKKNKIEHVSDKKWGKGWDLLQQEFERPIMQLSMSNYGIMFISHAKEVEISTRRGNYSKVAPDLPNQCRKIINPLVDIIGYADMDDGGGDEKRIIHFAPSKYITAGDRTGLLPTKMDLNYVKFKRCFKQKEKGDY